MSLLTPLYIAGILAVSLPILFHLFRRTPQGRQLFSSLMFLMPSPPRLSRRSRLENWPLLLLRALVIGLLALAFARPLWRQIAQAPVDTGQGRWIALLIDTSASMRREDLWQQAQAKVDRALADVSPLDRVALFTFDQQPRALIDFDAWLAAPHDARLSLIRQRLFEQSPTWGDTNLAAALVAVAQTLDDSEAQSQPERVGQVRRIVLISDLQQGSRIGALQSYEWPKNVELQVELVAAQATTNAALELVQDAELPWQVSDPEGPRVRVTNAPDSKAERFRIGWNTIEAAADTVTADTVTANRAKVDIYVPPGHSRVVRAPPVATSSKPQHLLLEGDGQPFDNRLFVVAPQQQHSSVLYLGHDQADDPKQLLYYLLPAFPETPWRSVRIVPQLPDQLLLAAELDDVPLIVVADEVPLPQHAALRHYVQQGGRLLLALKQQGKGALLAALAQRPEISLHEANVRQYAMLGQIDFGHPLFAPQADPRFSDFTKIHFWRHRSLDETQFPSAKVLARFDDGDPALMELSLGQGYVYVLASTWQPADSQLALSSKFVPLLHGLLAGRSEAADRLALYDVGARVPLGQVPEAEALSPTIRLPGGAEIKLASSSPWEFHQTSEPGIYQVNGAPAIQEFAVNVAAAESKTAPLAIEELEKLGVRLASHKPELPPEQLEAQRRQMLAVELESQQKLWRWLIVAALIVLGAETWLAGWLTHRAAK